jgi:hypothetical protein
MEIISAVVTGSVIREGFGKQSTELLLPMLARPSFFLQIAPAFLK